MSREVNFENDGTTARASHSHRAAVLVFSKPGKSIHRQDAKTAKRSLSVRLFSVRSVLSVSPW